MSRALLLVYFIVEIAAFVAVAQWIGVGWAILALGGLFLFGIIVAAWEMRRLTARALADATAAQEPMDARRAMASAGTLVVDSAMLMVGCVLLALPGFVSTVLGLLLILPPTKWLIRVVGGASLARWFQRTGSKSMFVVQRYGVKYPDGGERVIDHDDLGDPARDPRFDGAGRGADGFTTDDRPHGRSLPPGSGDVIDEVPEGPDPNGPNDPHDPHDPNGGHPGAPGPRG